jgi:hypothetical protein
MQSSRSSVALLIVILIVGVVAFFGGARYEYVRLTTGKSTTAVVTLAARVVSRGKDGIQAKLSNGQIVTAYYDTGMTVDQLLTSNADQLPNGQVISMTVRRTVQGTLLIEAIHYK